MISGSVAARSFGFGALVGLVVLGIGGRLTMRVLAWATGEPTAFSFNGTASIAFLGAAWGGLMGPVGALISSHIRSARSAVVLHWLAAFVVATIPLMVMLFREGAISYRPHLVLSAWGAGAFGALFLGYAALMGRLSYGAGTPTDPGPVGGEGMHRTN